MTAANSQGHHHSQALASGLEVHLVRQPNSTKWKIQSMDLSSDPRSGEYLTTKTWFAAAMGLDRFEFDTTDAAYAFVERHAKLT